MVKAHGHEALPVVLLVTRERSQVSSGIMTDPREAPPAPMRRRRRHTRVQPRVADCVIDRTAEPRYFGSPPGLLLAVRRERR